MKTSILDYSVVQPGFEAFGAEPTLRMLIYKYYAGQFDEKKACKFAGEYISQLEAASERPVPFRATASNGPVTVSIRRKTLALKRADGSPLMGGDIVVGQTLSVNPKTGVTNVSPAKSKSDRGSRQ